MVRRYRANDGFQSGIGNNVSIQIDRSRIRAGWREYDRVIHAASDNEGIESGCTTFYNTTKAAAFLKDKGILVIRSACQVLKIGKSYASNIACIGSVDGPGDITFWADKRIFAFTAVHQADGQGACRQHKAVCNRSADKVLDTGKDLPI